MITDPMEDLGDVRGRAREEAGAGDGQAGHGAAEAAPPKKRRRKADLNHELRESPQGSSQWCCKTCPKTFTVKSQWEKHEKNMLIARDEGKAPEAACAFAATLDGIAAQLLMTTPLRIEQRLLQQMQEAWQMQGLLLPL